jgi:hypothetical protein
MTDYLVDNGWHFDQRTEKWVAPWDAEIDARLFTTEQAVVAEQAYELYLVECAEGAGYVGLG